jgi:hypothetical protein
MLTQKSVLPGEYVRVELHGEGTLNQGNEGVVVRCREYGDGWFEVGLKYGVLSPGGALPAVNANAAA